MRTPLAVLPVLALAPAALAQPAEGLAPYFGFQESRFVKVDEGCGPTTIGDFNGDGRPDLAVINNRKSRIEVYYLRAAKRTAEELQRAVKVNELPQNPWYDREYISVAHRVMAVIPFDVDGDKKLDLVYAGAQPSELVVLQQGKGGAFDVLAKQRIRDLAAGPSGMAVADVIGDAAPEVLAMVGDKINVFPLAKNGRMGEPAVLGSGDKIRALHVEDFNGDGRADVLAVVPEDAAPLRLWLQSQDPRESAKAGLLAAELRFEMPQIREALPVRFPGRAAASIGVIERASQRLVYFDLVPQSIGGGAAQSGLAEREVQAEVTAFSDTGSKSRSVAIADTTGDGMPDLLTNDQKANSVVVFRQQKGVGLGQGEPFSAFKQPKQIETGRWFDGEGQQVFVLSEEEKAVGIAAIEAGRIAFPKPIGFKAAGATPVVMELAEGERPTLAVILKDRRDYVLELHRRAEPGQGAPTGEWAADIASIPLKDVKRDPTAIIPYDYDRDGVGDYLVLTPGEPMMMVHCVQEGGQLKPDKVLTRETIPQFGLVQAAGPDNTALLDADGDGKLELLIADANYVRFCAYDDKAGWRVVDQVNVPDPSTQLVGLSLMESGEKAAKDTRIVAADKANGRLIILGRNEAGRWVPRERIRLVGFPVGAIRAGSFAGDGQPGVLCLSDDAFALVRLGGQRLGLEEFAAFRTDQESRVEHNMAAGDLNGDGYLDVVVLDAREAMCQVLTFSASRKLVPATEFKVFESRLFQRGDTRELEPSDAIIGDVTGDKADDLLLQVHDRVIIYPQMTADK